MNSIKIGWSEQKSDEINTRNKNKTSRSRSTRKTPLDQIKPSVKAHRTRTVRFNQSIEEHCYTPFSPTDLIQNTSNNSADEILIYNNNRLCNVRAAITTFIIITILILAAGTSIGIVFGVLNASNSSGTKNNSQKTSFTTITSGLLTSSIRYGNQSGSPCSGYTEINDPTRNINYTGTYRFCDNGAPFNTSNGGAWIRFVGAGGSAIPTTPPGYSHCGGYTSGWYNDTLPLVTNVIMDGTLCFGTNDLDMIYMIRGSVILCPGTPNNYYVYFLPPVGICSARYCTN